MSGAVIGMPDELIVDSFAGRGGASTGIELATRRPVDIAIDHDPDAILMHKTNHPRTEHIQASVWDVDPVEVCAGRPVGLLWASPGLQAFLQSQGREARGQAYQGPRLDRPALGGNGAAAGDHPGERGGVPDLGTGAPGTPGEIKSRTDLPQMAGAASGLGV